MPDVQPQTPQTPSPAPEAAASTVQVDDRRLTLRQYLDLCIRNSGSDVHFQAGSVPMIRIDGKGKFLRSAPMDDETIRQFIDEIIAGHREGDQFRKTLEQRGAVDIAFSVPGMARFRTNIFHSRERYAIVLRRIETKIPIFTDLNLPPQVEALSEVHRGIVVVSGTTGSGKSTTLAAIIGKINRSRSDRIITVEDPIEYQHENAKSLVSQVEVGTDTESYEYALRSMMHQDPDCILIGEIRDTFSLTTALRAADTGHLVFTTVHAINASQTIERLVSLFDPAQKDLQQTQLGMTLVAVCCQRLAKRREGPGRVPVVEIMQATPLTKRYILEGEYEKLTTCVGNREAGCQSFDQHLTELFQKQIIDVAEARRLATNADALNLALRGIGASESRIR